MKKIVLMYHDVYNSSVSESGFQFQTSFPYKVSAQEFEKHVQYAHNYCKLHNLSLDSINFSFDDGGESFLIVIAPILEKYGFKGIFCISTQLIGTDKFLTRDQIKELHNRGHVIASHSHTHPKNMSVLSMQELLTEWQLSKNILEEIIQKPITIASVPSGYSSANVIKSALSSGITTLYTSKPTSQITHYNDMDVVGRFVVHHNTMLDDVRKIISMPAYRTKQLLKWYVICLAKKIFGRYYNRIKARCFKH